VRFSRARKRYERQGILVEAEALERAEQETESGSSTSSAAALQVMESRKKCPKTKPST
jgi:hypothetical protein